MHEYTSLRRCLLRRFSRNVAKKKCYSQKKREGEKKAVGRRNEGGPTLRRLREIRSPHFFKILSNSRDILYSPRTDRLVRQDTNRDGSNSSTHHIHGPPFVGARVRAGVALCRARLTASRNRNRRTHEARLGSKVTQSNLEGKFDKRLGRNLLLRRRTDY